MVTSKLERDFAAFVRVCADKGVSFRAMLDAVEDEQKARGEARPRLSIDDLDARIARARKNLAALQEKAKRLRASQKKLAPTSKKVRAHA